MNTNAFGVFVGVLLVLCLQDVSAYSKYGRTCKDIGCRSDEVCVLAEDPCTFQNRGECGSYPTCTKTRAGGQSCASIVCQENEYCRSENGVPRCVQKNSANGYDSAGISYVNGQRTSSSEDRSNVNTHNNYNPYSNANAPPPAPPVEPSYGSDTSHRTNTGTDLGYPAYPANTGSSNNNGYPPYPSTNQNNRGSLYPSDPHQGRYPQNAQYPQQPQQPWFPGYPPPNSGLPTNPGQRNPSGTYPGYPYRDNQQGFGHNIHSVRYSGSNEISASILTICLTMLIALFGNRS